MLVKFLSGGKYQTSFEFSIFMIYKALFDGDCASIAYFSEEYEKEFEIMYFYTTNPLKSYDVRILKVFKCL